MVPRTPARKKHSHPMQQTNLHLAVSDGPLNDTGQLHRILQSMLGSVSAFLARNSASSIAPSSPAYRELNFICPQFEQVHHFRSISVVQNSQRQVGGGGAGAGAGAAVEPDAEAGTDGRWAIRDTSRAFVFFFGGLSVRSITAGLGPGCLGVTGTCNVVSLRSTPQASQHKKSCRLCRVHTEQIQNRSSLGRGGIALLLLVLPLLLLPTPEFDLVPSNDTVVIPCPVITFSAGDEVTYEPPKLALSSS